VVSRRVRTALNAEAEQDITAALARNHPAIVGTPAAEPPPSAVAILVELRHRRRSLNARKLSRRIHISDNLVLWHLVLLRGEGLVLSTPGSPILWSAAPT
jgi:DNA-binding transcriptional ArsR family regulator